MRFLEIFGASSWGCLNTSLKIFNFILEVRGKHYRFLGKGSDMIKGLFGGRLQWHQHRRWASVEAGTPVRIWEQHLSIQVSSPRDHFVIFILGMH